jgi:hypothetical protein
VVGAAPVSVRLRPSDLPLEGLRLLDRSERDSCAVCAENHRKEAFEEIGRFYYPGVIVDGLRSPGLLRRAGLDAELALPAPDSGGTAITFRFHTAGNHLVGIAESDYTDETLARRFTALPVGEARACVRVIAYAYGDGAAFLYSPSSRHLEIECRLDSLLAE